MSNSKKIVFIVGPTAIGKSRLSVFLAKEIKGEIISCDSMQIYKEISILSAKPSAEDRRGIAHYLLDVVSVEEGFDVAQYRAMAINAIDDIHSRGSVPIIVGGSGMYMQVLLDGIFEGTNKNIELREHLKKQAEEKGSQFLYNQLKEKDLKAAEKIHPNDTKRIIRALEVCILSNNPISKVQKDRKGLWGEYDIRAFCLNMERKKLYSEINKRVDKMFKRGVVNEIKAICDKKLSITAERIIGFKAIAEYIEGKDSIEEAKEKLKMNTRRYAKRQLTWFRKDKRLEWIDIEGKKDNELINIMKDRIYE